MNRRTSFLRPLLPSFVFLFMPACYSGVAADNSDGGGASSHGGDSPTNAFDVEEAFPGVAGTPATMYLSTPDGTFERTYLHLENGYGVLEGDIILYEPEDENMSLSEPGGLAGLSSSEGLEDAIHPASPDHLCGATNPQRGGVVSWIGRRWPNRRIPWEYHPDVSDDIRDVVGQAIDDLDDALVDVDFAQYNAATDGPDADRIQVVQGTGGCSSPVGRIGGRQTLRISPNCAVRGTVIHEFSHAIGLWHEQSREDRDSHVTVNTANAVEAHSHNFEKKPSDDVGNYNTSSIMHYHSCGFSRCHPDGQVNERCYNGDSECGFSDRNTPGCGHCICENEDGQCMFPTIVGPGGTRIDSQREALEPSDIAALKYALGCPGGLNGDYCGGPVGLDEDTLYACNNGHYTEKQDCGNGTCVVAAPGYDDKCSNQTQCPSGDGWYCGQGVGLLQDHLYWCDSGAFHMSMPEPIDCGLGRCVIAPAGNHDHCVDESPLPPPDPNADCLAGPCCDAGIFRPEGTVCADDISSQYGCPWGTSAGDDVGVRYRDQTCSGLSAECNGPLGQWEAWQTQEACASNEYCSPGDATCNDVPAMPECAGGSCCDPDGFFQPAGYVCGQDADSEYGCPWGSSPGDDVGVRFRDQTCSGGSSACDGSYGVWKPWETQDACGLSEICEPGFSSCSPVGCQESTYWSPALVADVDSTGLQSNQSINVSLQMEVREIGSQLEFRVCKLNDGAFQQSIKVAIYDAATNNQVGKNVTLATAGMTCSGWTGMDNDGNYQEGQVFGGSWNVVSPSTSAGDWATWGGCTVNGNPTGTCWSGFDITMTRTCK